jgi:DNA topoisomerase-1
MKPALYEVTTAAITAGPYGLKAKGSRLLFAGFCVVNGGRGNAAEMGGENGEVLPPLTVGEALRFLQAKPEQHFTEPPARYTEATLIKELEEKGIGRPSTYAPTLNTLLERGYVSKEGRALLPEDLGRVVNGLLVGNFEEIVDVNFTAKMEEDLDSVATGEKKWVPLLRDFYTPFAQKLIEKEEVLKKADFTVLGKTQEKCPECGGFLVKKLGKYGTFLSCENFPQCKFGKPLEGGSGKDEGGSKGNAGIDVDQKQLEDKCPQDGGELVLKVGRFGKFIACKNYPQCKFTKPYLDKIGMKCPRCGEGEVIVKRGKFKKNFFGCSRYPQCKWATAQDPRQKSEEEKPLEQSGESKA